MYYRPETYGAYGDGASHPLSSVYPNLAAAQTVYPHATSLTNEIDWCAIQAAINAARVEGAGERGGNVRLSGGKHYLIGNKSIFCGRVNHTDKHIYEFDGQGAKVTGTGDGNVLLDWAGAIFFYCHDVLLVGDDADPPSVGTLSSRLDASVTGGTFRSVGQSNYQRLIIEGSFRYATVFNLRAEVQTFIRCYFQNKLGPYVVRHTQGNPDNVTSPNATLTNDIADGTSTVVHWLHCNFNHINPTPVGDYACVFISGCHNVSFRDCLFHDEAETGPLIKVGEELTRPAHIAITGCVMHHDHKYAVLFDNCICDDFTFTGNRTSGNTTADIASVGTVILDRPTIEAAKVDLSTGSSQIRNGGLVKLAIQGDTSFLSVASRIACKVECRQADTLTLPGGANNLAEIYYVD